MGIFKKLGTKLTPRYLGKWVLLCLAIWGAFAEPLLAAIIVGVFGCTFVAIYIAWALVNNSWNPRDWEA